MFAHFQSLSFCNLYRWIESCIKEKLPPRSELEDALRNGVILCKLGHYYAPDVLPLKKIYDLDQSKYKVRLMNDTHTYKSTHKANHILLSAL